MPTSLSWVNLADAAEEITATHESPGLGVRNLLTEPIGEVWRVPPQTLGTVTNLDITLSGFQTVGVIALRAPHDGVMPASMRIEGAGSVVSMGASDTLTIPDQELALGVSQGYWWHWPAAPVAVRYLRLRLTHRSPDEYLQLGRIWIGADLRPQSGAAFTGAQRGVATAGGVERAAISGTVTPARGATWRVMRFALPTLRETEAQQVENMARAVGTHGQVLAHPRTTEGVRGLVLGRFADLPQPRKVSALLWGAEITIAEDL